MLHQMIDAASIAEEKCLKRLQQRRLGLLYKPNLLLMQNFRVLLA